MLSQSYFTNLVGKFLLLGSITTYENRKSKQFALNKNELQKMFLIYKCLLKLRHYEKATKFEKKSPTCFDKTAVLLSGVKMSGRFFRIFVTFSEKVP